MSEILSIVDVRHQSDYKYAILSLTICLAFYCLPNCSDVGVQSVWNYHGIYQGYTKPLWPIRRQQIHAQQCDDSSLIKSQVSMHVSYVLRYDKDYIQFWSILINRKVQVLSEIFSDAIIWKPHFSNSRELIILVSSVIKLIEQYFLHGFIWKTCHLYQQLVPVFRMIMGWTSENYRRGI